MLTESLLMLSQAITYRKVLQDDHRGKPHIQLEHEAEWRFLVFSGRFKTRLHVFQDRAAGTVSALLSASLKHLTESGGN